VSAYLGWLELAAFAFTWWAIAATARRIQAGAEDPAPLMEGADQSAS